MDELSDFGTNAYLIFQIEEDYFAAEVEKVIRISEIPTITPIPKAPAYLKGVINQRGTVIPLLNTSYKFGIDGVNEDELEVIILFKIFFNEEEVEIAAPVTAVKDVISAEDIVVSQAPEMGLKYKPEYVKGMIVQGEKFIILLDIDKVFSSEEIIRIKESTSEINQ